MLVTGLKKKWIFSNAHSECIFHWAWLCVSCFVICVYCAAYFLYLRFVNCLSSLSVRCAIILQIVHLLRMLCIFYVHCTSYTVSILHILFCSVHVFFRAHPRNVSYAHSIVHPFLYRSASRIHSVHFFCMDCAVLGLVWVFCIRRVILCCQTFRFLVECNFLCENRASACLHIMHISSSIYYSYVI